MGTSLTWFAACFLILQGFWCSRLAFELLRGYVPYAPPPPPNPFKDLCGTAIAAILAILAIPIPTSRLAGGKAREAYSQTQRRLLSPKP